MSSLPADLQEHAGTIAVLLLALLCSLSALLLAVWRTREREKENAVASALKGVSVEIARLGDRFDTTVSRIFDEMEGIKGEVTRQAIVCASRHGAVSETTTLFQTKAPTP